MRSFPSAPDHARASADGKSFSLRILPSVTSDGRGDLQLLRDRRARNPHDACVPVQGRAEGRARVRTRNIREKTFNAYLIGKFY